MSATTPPAAAAPVAASGAAVAAPPAPVPSPQYTPPPPATPAPAMAENGGATGGGNAFTNFFSDVNVMDVAISAFIIGAVIYSIQYHKMMMLLEKTGYADLSSRVQKLESALEAAKKKAEVNASGGQRRKRALITL